MVSFKRILSAVFKQTSRLHAPEDRLHKPAHRVHGLCHLAASIGIAFLGGFGPAGSASAGVFSPLPAVTEPIRTGGRAYPTEAWIRFCQERPRECAVDVSQPARVSLDLVLWSLITTVNERVNAAILPVTDLDRWGVLDRWDYPDDGMGDCEDIQLLKRRRLIQAGLPRRALRMAVVLDEHGEGHAVLMVLTDRGDFILDNKRSAVLPWRSTGYTFLKREGTNSSVWVALGHHAAPIVTSNR